MSEAPPPRFLLDTHALLWLLDGSLPPAAAEKLAGAELLVSAVSAWELGLLARPLSGPPRIRLDPDPEHWWARALTHPAISEVFLTPAIALATSNLPGDLHRDPADRMLVATARTLDVPLATRDRRILAYAEAGHVRAMAC